MVFLPYTRAVTKVQSFRYGVTGDLVVVVLQYSKPIELFIEPGSTVSHLDASNMEASLWEFPKC